MSSSISIEISGGEAAPSGASRSSSNVSEEFDLSPEPSASAQPSQWPQWQTADRTVEAETPPSYAAGAGDSGSASHIVEPPRYSGEGATTFSQQQLQMQEQQQFDTYTSTEPQPSYGEDVQSAPLSGEGVQALEYGASAASMGGVHQQSHLQQDTPPTPPTQQQKQWSQLSSPDSPHEGHSPREGPREESPSPASPAAASSLRASASAVAPRRLATPGQPGEGILKRRTEKWTEQSTMGEDVVIGSKSKLWLAPGSVLWRFFCSALALRIGSSLALLVVVLTTLGRMGKAVSCVDMSNCVDGGGIMAFPTLLRALPNFGAGIVAYQAITGSLVAGLVLILLPMAGNCYFTCQALLKGTKKAYLEEVRVTTYCTAWVGACVGVFIPPAFFTEQFCGATSFDVNAAYRDEGSPIAAASRNMCDQVGFSWACIGVALLCVCSNALLLFQRYSRLWAALLGLGCLKFMFAGFLLCFTIMLGGQSNEMMLETMDDAHRKATELAGLQRSMVAQLGLVFASLKWGGYILAFGNLACGASTLWAAHLRSHLLSCTNMVANFVLFFVNAVSFFAMLFEFATFRVVCNYPMYPMTQSKRARAEAAFICSARPQFMFMWFLVALLALIHLIEFFVSAVLFQRELCRSKPRTGALMSAPSIDSLPPKWGIKR